jgi:hypothetical protein
VRSRRKEKPRKKSRSAKLDSPSKSRSWKPARQIALELKSRNFWPSAEPTTQSTVWIQVSKYSYLSALRIKVLGHLISRFRLETSIRDSNEHDMKQHTKKSRSPKLHSPSKARSWRTSAR